jgi:hypothetical protein
MTITTPGALVRYREREWVVLPSDDLNPVLLRPIGGSAREVCGVVKPLAATPVCLRGRFLITSELR